MSDTTNIKGDYVGGDKPVGDKVMGDKHVHLPDPRPKAFINPPAYNPNFTGRTQELDTITVAFSPS